MAKNGINEVQKDGNEKENDKTKRDHRSVMEGIINFFFFVLC